MAVWIRCADHVTPLYPQKLALTSPTGGGRSVGIVRSRNKATEFVYSSLSLHCTFTIYTSHEDKEVFSDCQTFYADRNFSFTSSWVAACRRPRVGLLSLSGSSSLTCANYGNGELLTPSTTHPQGSYWANYYPTGYRAQETLLQLIICLLRNIHF